MWGRASEWEQLAQIISRGARDLLDEFRRADATARLTVTVQLDIGEDSRVCRVQMGAPESAKAEKSHAAPGRSESPPGRPDAASTRDRTWAGLGARHER